MTELHLRLLSGTLVLLILAFVASSLSSIISLNQLVIAIILGALVGNTIGTPRLIEPGISLYKRWLEVGIILLGAQIMVHELFETGPLVVGIVLAIILSVIALTEILGKMLEVTTTMRALLAAGIAICGISAVVAVARGVQARQEEVAYVVTTILIFDGITLVLYPLIGILLDLEPFVFGLWAGLTMFSTGPVAAAGFTHSAEAGGWAIVTKLIRNSLLGFIVVWFSLRNAATRPETSIGLEIWRSFPKFVLGFFLLALLASLGFFSSADLSLLDTAFNWTFLVAFVGLGFDLRISQIRDATFKPLFITCAVFSIVSLLTLGLLVLIFGS